MAFTKFVIQPTKPNPNQTLTSFEAPKIAQSSTSFNTTSKSAPKPAAPRVAPQPTYSSQFVGAGGNTAFGTGTNVNNQQVVKSSPTKSQTASSQYGVGGMPVTSPTFAMEGGESTIDTSGLSAMASGSSGSTGTTGAGAGGYTPPGLSPIDEPVDTGIPDPSNVSAQPFTQPGTGGAIGADGTQTGTQGETLASKYEQGFNAANAALGGTGGQLPSGTSGASLVQSYSPTKSNTVASMFVQTDPFIEGLVTAWQDYISPQNQRKSLADTYNQMLKDSGIEAIDMELINTKNVIEGAEDDIRTEITKAGGFATNSQVLALTNARNKQLIKNYNTLLDTRNAKEKYLQTAIGLEQADRESADRRFESAFSMGTQLATLQNQMQNNARTQAQWLASNIGFDGLYDATGGDRYAMGLIEQTLGLPQGGLLQASNQARKTKALAQQEKDLDIKYKQAQISNIYSEIAQRNADNTMMFDPLGKILVKPSEALKINKELVSSDAYKSLTKAKDSLQYLKNFENTFNKTGATSAVFSPRQNAKLKAEYNTAILNLKEFFNLGVLNGPDEAILRSVIPDPTNRSAALSVLSLGIYKPSAQTKAGIDNMKKMIEASLDDRYKSLSSQYGDYSTYSVKGLGDLNRIYVEQKAKLNPNIETLINENPDLTYEDLLMIISQ